MCREGTYGRNCEFSEYTTTTSKAPPVENATTVVVANVTTEAITITTTESSVKNLAETENETN